MKQQVQTNLHCLKNPKTFSLRTSTTVFYRQNLPGGNFACIARLDKTATNNPHHLDAGKPWFAAQIADSHCLEEEWDNPPNVTDF
jgi:hypothetical protein